MKRILLAALVAATPAAADPLADVAASRIAAISDGDFLASTYADAVLAPFGAHEDVLTVLTPGGPTVTAPASNSVTAAPEILAAAPDGRTFYVVDRLARGTAEARRTPDLAPGRTLTAVRLTDGEPTVTTHAIPPGSEALAISPDGTRLAIVGNDAERSTLTLVPLVDGVPGEPVVHDAAAFGLVGGGEGPRGGMLLTNVQWHPDGDALAVNDTTLGRVALLRLDGDRVAPWGEPVAAGKDPFVGRFTPDGRFYLTSEWGRDFAATSIDGRLPTTPGRLGVTRVDDDGRHQRIGAIDTDTAPEGIAISPDGRLVATVNMRSTVFPGTPRFTREATVTLVALDPAGLPTKLSDTPFEGVLPEGAAFDADGGHLLVTVFEGHAGQAEQSGLAVFRVDAAAGRLVPTGRVPLPHGTHHVVVVP